MPTADLNGITTYYEVIGQGRPLVLSHGFACGAKMWDPQVAAFADRYRVVTYDVRGHGASTAPEDSDAYGPAISVEDLRQLMLHLGLRDVCLGGLSMGGGIALELALAHPELLAGLIVADAGSGSDDPDRWRGQLERRIASLESGGIEAAADTMLTEPTFASYASRGPEETRHMRSLLTTHRAHGLAGTMRGLATRRHTYDLEAELRALTVPTLIIVGEHDEPCRKPARFLADTIPNAQLVVIKGVGHMTNLEDPTTFNAAVDDFLVHLWCA